MGRFVLGVAKLRSLGASGQRAGQRFRAGLGLVCLGWAASACSSDQANAGAPKYYEDVAPLVAQHCVGCHRDGGIAPFALTSYDQVKAHASDIESDTAARKMPPMPVDNSGQCNTYSNARWLNDDEIALLGRWVKGGTPAGDPSKTTALPEPPASLTDPDAMLDIGTSYAPSDASGHDDYRCFVVPSPVSERRYVTAYEVLPGQQREVHHVIVYQPSNDAEATAAHAKDDAADGAGRDEIGARMRIGDAGEEAPDVRVEGFAHQREVKRKDLALCQRRRCGAP
jgi:hypothetical protein